MKRTVIIFMSVLVLLIPVMQVFASSEACFRAEKDADAAESGLKFVYFGAGCLLGPIGMLIGYTVMPPIPENRIMGKSSGYVADYVNCFNEKALETQGPASLFGCLTLLAGGTVALFIFWAYPIWNSMSKI
jgi:hypothetical protein